MLNFGLKKRRNLYPHKDLFAYLKVPPTSTTGTEYLPALDDNGDWVIDDNGEWIGELSTTTEFVEVTRLVNVMATDPNTSPKNFTVYGHWLTCDGVLSLSAPHLTGSEIIVKSTGDAVPTVAAGAITFTAGSCGYVELDDGTKYVLQASNTSTQGAVYDVSGNGNHGALTGHTAPAFTTIEEGSYLLASGFYFDGTNYIPAGVTSHELTQQSGKLTPDSPVVIEMIPNASGWTIDQEANGPYTNLNASVNQVPPSTLQNNYGDMEYYGQRGILLYSEPQNKSEKIIKYLKEFPA